MKYERPTFPAQCSIPPTKPRRIYTCYILIVLSIIYLSMLLRVNGNSLEGLFPPSHYICCQTCFFTSHSESFVA